MNQEQLMKAKIKYLEDRIEVMAKSIGSINKILGRFQMTENNDTQPRFIERNIITKATRPCPQEYWNDNPNHREE